LISTLFELLPEQSGDIHCARGADLFHITVSVLASYKLVMLRTTKKQENFAKYSNDSALMRSYLSTLAATADQLAEELRNEQRLAAYQNLLSIQQQAIYRILRLTRQKELSYDNWEQEYPLGTVDLAAACTKLSFELSSALAKQGPHFTYRSEVTDLLLMGNKSLLNYLILALLSNAIKSAGSDGTVELSLVQKKDRALISVWDSGLAIPEDRLMSLFSDQNTSALPRPNEGTGLDLWIAHRITLFHHGVIMAANRPNYGTEFTISLPIKSLSKQQLQTQHDSSEFKNEGFSPILVGLADALPREAFEALIEP
jgi:signal transduction histidine kinase